jgi:hypothetical protein
MRDVTGKLSDEGLSKPLSFGERKVLEMQHHNRELGDGNRPEDDERARMRAMAVDTAMKTPTRDTYGG